MASSRVSDPSLIVAGLLSAGILTAPAFAGPPFRTDDPETVDFQHFEINLFSVGTKTADGWTGILPGLEVNYGALPNLQLSVVVGQGYAAPVGGRTSFAFEDVTLGQNIVSSPRVKMTGFRRWRSIPQCSCRLGIKSSASALDMYNIFCRSGYRKTSVPGRSMAAAATGSIRVPATRTTASQVWQYGERSVNN